jgi:hypothetical protein
MSLFDLLLVLFEDLLLKAFQLFLFSLLDVSLLLQEICGLLIIKEHLVILEVLDKVVKHTQLHIFVLLSLLLRG